MTRRDIAYVTEAEHLGKLEAKDERLGRVVRLARVQAEVLASIYVQFGKKNMHLLGEWETAEAALLPGDLEHVEVT